MKNVELEHLRFLELYLALATKNDVENDTDMQGSTPAQTPAPSRIAPCLSNQYLLPSLAEALRR